MYKACTVSWKTIALILSMPKEILSISHALQLFLGFISVAEVKPRREIEKSMTVKYFMRPV
jgi:hypothetical protein